MKSWLFALGLALCCAVRADDMMPFELANITRMGGLWNCLATASNCSCWKKIAQNMTVIPVKFSPIADNEFNLTISVPVMNTCKVFNATFKKENGLYTTTCGKGVKKTAVSIQTDYEEHAFVALRIDYGRKDPCGVAACLSKELHVSSDFQSKCEAFAKRVGQNNVQEHPIKGMCDPPQ